MKKQHIFYLVIGIVILTIIAGGLYMHKYRSCLKRVNYVPPREQGRTGGGLSGLQPVLDRGNYYRFDFQEFKTSEDALRACIWK